MLNQRNPSNHDKFVKNCHNNVTSFAIGWIIVLHNYAILRMHLYIFIIIIIFKFHHWSLKNRLKVSRYKSLRVSYK